MKANETTVSLRKVGVATLRRVNRNLCYLCKVEIFTKYRGMGYYPDLRDLARARAKELGFKGWMFTVRPDNKTHFNRVWKHFGPPINAQELAAGNNVAGLWWELL